LFELGRYGEARHWLELAAARDPSDQVTQKYLRSLEPARPRTESQLR
jgi:hypothetical protein